ncbi:acyl carrier protein [Micromonospora lupini]|uniref:acyl carrier protein n=1 Tax=Micromonospora lupini TaxID=285679 RepID=UPI0033FA1E57
MTHDDDLLAIVRSAVAEVADGHPVTDDTPLIAERVVDSLSLLSLVARLEQRLPVRIGDSDVLPGNFASIRAIHRFLRDKISHAV